MNTPQPTNSPAGPTVPNPNEATTAPAGTAAPTTATVQTTTDGKRVGRPVIFDDVYKHFNPKCKFCRQGEVIGTRVDPKTGQTYQFVAACGCAHKRFFKAHPEIIEDPETKQCFWPPPLE